MKEKKLKHKIQNILWPCVVFAGVTGVVTGAVVFAFRVISEGVINVSHHIYGFAHENPQFIPLVVAGAVLAALLVAFCLTYSPHSRGGGIPTAVALIRGLITFHWLRNIVFVFTSALLSYLCGIPLGNDEGPAVQMGTAVGSGTARVLGKKRRAWERYLMTGGATAGFATATCAPVTAVLFGLEEGHSRFSPLLIMSSVSSVLCGMGTLELLCRLFDKSSALFHFTIAQVLPLSLVWVVIPVGLLCGGFAYVFGECTHAIRGLLHKKFKHVHTFFKVAPVFAVVAIIGCVYYDAIGTGHHLIESLLEHRVAWYVSLLLLVIRSLLVILSNDVGATGGLFTPLLSFGALIGSAVAEALVALNVLDETHFMLMVVVGMVSFFAASVRTPLTAMAFAIEALSGFGNILPILLAVMISYVIVEAVGANSINEIAMEREIHKENRGKALHVVDVTVEALPGSFAIGKEPRDILWPPSCKLLSVKQENAERHFYTGGHIEENDVLRLNFTTYDPERTAAELCALLGEQEIYDEDVISHDTFENTVSEHP
ncbi:MAG: chloride channel protein [Clostridia bacterium]|nr:chloride channel protein [Clostridia bacterium]